MRNLRSWLFLVFVALHPISQAQDQYFPERSFNRNAKFSQSLADYYSTELKVLGEQSFLRLSKESSQESYRFLWLRSFHQPIAVRLDVKPDGSSVVTTKVGNGEAGYPGTNKKLIKETSIPVSREETQAFLAQVKQLRFWSTPRYVKNDQTGTDGSDWIIEAIRGGNYHVVARWSPDERNPTKRTISKLGLALAFDLAKMNIPQKEIY